MASSASLLNDTIERELQVLAQQIEETLTTAQNFSPSDCSSSAAVPTSVQIVQIIGSTIKQQNELSFKLVRIGREMVNNCEEMARRNAKLEEENGKLRAMKESLDESQNNVLVLERKCQKLQQNLAECKEFLNRMAMEDDFRNNNDNNGQPIIVEEEKENNAPETVLKAVGEQPENNSLDIIFVDDVIRNKWVAKIGQKVVKNEPVEVVELDEQPTEEECRPCGSQSAVHSPSTKRVKKEV